MDYVTEYIDEIFKNEFLKLSAREYEYRDNISVEKREDAIVLPFIPDLNCSTKGIGGVVDKDGKYINFSATTQESLMPCGYEAPLNCKQYDDTVIYLGYFIMQWGHFLVDFVPRLWWLKENYHGEKLLVLTSNKNAKLNGNYLELLTLFGIREEKIHYVYEPEKHKTIIVPEMSMVRPQYFSNKSEELFQYIIDRATSEASYKSYDKIYFSRSKLKKAAMTELGEKDFEKIYKRNGYKIIYPEKCSFRELVWYINSCKEFVSLSGTIPHNIVFASPNTKVVILNKTYRINTIQLMLNAQSKISPMYIDTNICMLPASPGSGPFWMEITENFVCYANDCGLMLPSSVLSSNAVVEYFRRIKKARRLQKYILMYVRLKDKYLDIGGSIVGTARPDEDFENKLIYYFYRNKIGEINTDTNPASFLTNLYHFIKEIRK